MSENLAETTKTKGEFMKNDALNFLKNSKGRIVSSGDLTTIQIAEFQANGSFFIDEETGLGWADVPWNLTTEKDRQREISYFNKNPTQYPRS